MNCLTNPGGGWYLRSSEHGGRGATRNRQSNSQSLDGPLGGSSFGVRFASSSTKMRCYQAQDKGLGT